MIVYRLQALVPVELDIEAAFEWYQAEEMNLGFTFLEEVRTAYTRIVNNPFAYHEIAPSIRRILTRRFPYAIYFTIENEIVLVLAVLHTARDPAEWQHRI